MPGFGGKIAPALLIPGPDNREIVLPNNQIITSAYAPDAIASEGPPDLGNFYVGAGNFTWVNNGDALPPAGYQAGDFLYVPNTSSTLAGWSALTGTGTTGSFKVFGRVATGDSNDNIPSSQSGVGRQIFATRDNASYTRNGTYQKRSIIAATQTNFPFPEELAYDFAGPGDASFIIYAGRKQMTTATFVNPGDTGMTETGQRVRTSPGLIVIIGIAFQLSRLDIPQADASYGLVQSSSLHTTVFRQSVNIL